MMPATYESTKARKSPDPRCGVDAITLASFFFPGIVFREIIPAITLTFL